MLTHFSSATASAVVRVYYVVISYNTGDFLFYALGINLWAIAEQTFGYLVLGIPSLPKIFRDFRLGRAFRSFSISRNKGSDSYNNNNNNANPSRDRDLEHGGSGSRSRPRWPGSPRGAGRHDIWEMSDLDTHMLVTVNEQEHDHDRAHGQGKDDNIMLDTISSHPPQRPDSLGLAVTRS
jgi:hypothetical protein